MDNLKLNNIIFIIIICLLIIILYYVYNKKENFNNYASQNNANNIPDSVVNAYFNINDIINMNNLNVTGNINFTTLKGVIVSWYKPITEIPYGWGICDGSTYTALDGTQIQSPDLRSKFILGASKPNTSTNGNVDGWGPTGQPNYPGLPLTPTQVGESGGAETHALSVDELPGHNHGVSRVLSWHTSQAYNGVINSGNNGYSSPAQTGSTGGNPVTPHNNMPPYYSLIYIIKL